MFQEYINSIIELFSSDPIAQTSGLIGMLLVWRAFLNEDDLKTIKILFIASFFWGFLYLMLESYAGFITSLIGALRIYLSMKYKKNSKVFLFIIILIIIAGIFTYRSVFSLLPIIGTLIGAYSFFYSSGIKLRIGCLFISILYLMYNIHILAIGGIINEIVVQILILITIIHYFLSTNYVSNIKIKINSIINPYKNIDYGHFPIVQSIDKYRINRVLKKLIIKIKEKIFRK